MIEMNRLNKKGQTMGIAILSAIVIFIFGMLVINFILNDVSDARVNLNCSDASSISDGTKLTCLFVDTAVPYFIWAVISIALGAVLAQTRIGGN